MATIPALEPDFLAAHPRSAAATTSKAPTRPSFLRRMARGLFNAAAYTLASLVLLATAPVLLVMSDRADVVRWSNDLLDLVQRW
jgi:hypothetical protein